MKQTTVTRHVMTVLLILLLPVAARSAHSLDSVVMNRLFDYASHYPQPDTLYSGVYVKYHLDVVKKNPTLMTIPSLYHIYRSKQRHFLCEEYTEVYFLSNHTTLRERKKRLSNIRANRDALPVVKHYITPHIYQTTLFDDAVLSPFVRHNSRLYRYKLLKQYDGTVWVVFKPKTRNTQTVRGHAVIDPTTGRIQSTKLEGEYDHIRFILEITMGEEGILSLLPSSCTVHTDFRFLGNKMTGDYHAVYGVNAPALPTDSDRELIEIIRPDTLTSSEQHIYAEYDSVSQVRMHTDSLNPHTEQKTFVKDVLWDLIGDRLLNRIRGHFDADRGEYRISPLLNPLYFGYSKRKGLYYRFHLRSKYTLNTNRDLSLRFKGGYSFKEHQFYFTLPLVYRFSKWHDGYISAEIGNGNRIFNSTVIDRIKSEGLPTKAWEDMGLDYFKDMNFTLTGHYDANAHWGFRLGAVYHKRTAINKAGFIEAGRPLHYHTFAPMTEIQFRPRGWYGPVLTLDYERGIKGVLHSSQLYERWEMDFSQIIPLPVSRRLSYRVGGGLYTSRFKNVYFLDYTNFREDNISGGWDDEWTGEFELLDRNWYNASKYYIRTNVTFESPLLILSRVPVAGSLMEKERIYVSALRVPDIKHYIELGYGFTNRLFSAGAFVSWKEGHYESFGMKFGFELFDGW